MVTRKLTEAERRELIRLVRVLVDTARDREASIHSNSGTRPDFEAAKKANDEAHAALIEHLYGI